MDESRGKSINVNLKLELQYGERNCFLEGNFQIRTDKENGFIIREDYRQSIRKELQGLGFPSSACGTIYLEEGIFYFIQKQKRQISITKELYPAVAEKYSTNSSGRSSPRTAIRARSIKVDKQVEKTNTFRK